MIAPALFRAPANLGGLPRIFLVLRSSAEAPAKLKNACQPHFNIGTAINRIVTTGQSWWHHEENVRAGRRFLKNKDAVKVVSFRGPNDANSWRSRARPLRVDAPGIPKPACDTVIKLAAGNAP